MTLEALTIARPIKPSPKLLVSTGSHSRGALLGFERTYPSQAWRGLSIRHVIWNGISSTRPKMGGKGDT